MTKVYLQKALQGKKLEWDAADDMSGWVAWLPEEIATESSDYGGGYYEFVEGEYTSFTVHKTKTGRKWIKTDHDGRGC